VSACGASPSRSCSAPPPPALDRVQIAAQITDLITAGKVVAPDADGNQVLYLL